MEMYSFEDVAGKWVPVGFCSNEAEALALLAKQVGGAQWSTVGRGEPEYWMMKTQNGWGRYSIPIYRVHTLG
jgi:hypothetical protein